MELNRIFSPLQGLFNIVVYCRPHVSSLRRNHPEFSWFKAFWLTVRTSGDNGSAGRSDRRSQVLSKKGRQKVLDRIERDHISRMRKLRNNKRKSSNNFALDDGESSEASAIKELVVEDCEKLEGQMMNCKLKES